MKTCGPLLHYAVWTKTHERVMFWVVRPLRERQSHSKLALTAQETCVQQKYLHCKLKHHVYTCDHRYRTVCTCAPSLCTRAKVSLSSVSSVLSQP